MEQLTPPQRKGLNKLKKYIDKYQRAPTRMEMSDMMDYLSPNAGHELLKALERKGYITMEPSISRGIRLTNKAE